MSNNLDKKAKALKSFHKSMKRLRDEGILTNKRDFTSQIGEWLVEMIYDGERAPSSNQEGWDVNIDGKIFQVKTHAKADTNNTRWSELKNYSFEGIDKLIIVVFTFDYKLKEFYRIPWEVASDIVRIRAQQKKKSKINWSEIAKYRIEINELPNQEIINLFK